MYTFVSVFVIAAVLFVCAATAFAGGKSLRTAALVLSLILLAAGISCLIAASVRTERILAEPAPSAEWREWAWDAYGLWARWAGVGSAILGGILLLAALIRHPKQRTRAAVCVAISALLLIGGGMYAVIVANDVADLVTSVHLITIACACLVPIAAYVDAAFARFAKKSVGKKIRKK